MTSTLRYLVLVAAVGLGVNASAMLDTATAQTVQSQLPHGRLVRPPKRTAQALGEEAKQAAQQAIAAARVLGGNATTQANALASLSPTMVIESLTVQPLSGPSTIAAPHIPPAAPVAALNYVGVGGGTIAAHPGVAFLLAQPEGQDNFSARCTGTLVRPNVILTAAHCVCDPAAYPTAAACRSQTRPSVLLDGERWRVFFQHAGLKRVSEVRIADNYVFNAMGVHDDLALLVLASPVTWITSATLPASPGATVWSAGIAAGFGFSAAPGATSATVLQQLVRPGLKSQGALKVSSCDNLSYLDKNEAFCSVYDPGGAGSAATICEGDSGGPLWIGDQQAIEIGITSGRDVANCAETGSTGFETRTDFGPYLQWVTKQLAQVGAPVVQGRWPAFGDNLLYVLDRRNVALFASDGSYTAQSWARAAETGVVLVTINSPGALTGLNLQDKATAKSLCSGLAGATQYVPNVDYCYATVVGGQQFRVIAQGDANERLQFVISSFPTGTAFPE